MTAIAFVSAADQQSATATVVVNKPTGGTATDVFVAHWAVAGNVADASMTLPAGWVQIAYLSPTGGPTVKLAYKVAVAGGEPNSYTFTLSAAALHTCGITRWSNVDTSHLSDAYVPVTLNSGTSGTSLTALDIVPESDNAMVIAAFANSINTSAITIPAGMSTAFARTTIVRNSVAYGLQAAGGHSNDKVATQSGSAGWTAILWAMRPLDLGAPITVTVGAVTSTSNLELSCTLVDDDLMLANGTFRATAIANMQGMFSRMVSFIGGFGANDPLKDWNGTGAVPAIGSMYTAGIDTMMYVPNQLGIPMDWIIWRLPWQFTENPNTGIDSVAADYYGTENRRVRRDATTIANYQLYIRRIAKYVIQTHGARRFKVGSEMKGFQQDTFNSPAQGQTWDYHYYYDFFTETLDAIMLGADDAGVSRSLITVGGPYPVVGHRGDEMNRTVTPPVQYNDIVSFDTKPTVTTPVETIRYKSAVGDPAPFSLNFPGWGFPYKAPLQAIVEFFKLCNASNTNVGFYSFDFGMYNNDNIIKSTDDLYVAEQRTRDHVRWGKKMLDTVAAGRYATAGFKNTIDITELYLKAQGTIADTYPTNTLLDGGGAKPPGPYLPDNQIKLYIAAIKGIGLAVCVEEGVRTPSMWSPFGRGDGRTAPLLTGGQQTDEQRQLSGAIVSLGYTGQGSLTPIGQVYKWLTQDFGAGTPIRAVTVSDPGKVYVLSNLSKSLVFNKTAGRKSVVVNGVTATLDPYGAQEVVFGNSFVLTGTTGSYTSTGSTATLRAVRKLTVVVGTYVSTGRAAQLLRISRLSGQSGAFSSTGQNASLKASRLLSASTGSYASVGNPARLIKIPPVSLIGDPGSYSSIGQDATLLFVRKLVGLSGSYSSTGSNAQLKVVRRLVASPGVYASVGQDAHLLFTRVLSALSGNYASTGQDALLLLNRRLMAIASSYVSTGQDARLLLNRVLVALAGIYQATGQDAALIFVRKLSAQSGSYESAGNNARLLFITPQLFVLIGQPGQYQSAGSDAQLRAFHKLDTSGGSYASAGANAELRIDRALIAQSGNYTSTGADAVLSYSGEAEVVSPPERTFCVKKENRVFVVGHEDRTYVVR